MVVARASRAIRATALALLIAFGVGAATCSHDDHSNGSQGSGTFAALGVLPGDVASEAAAVSFDGRVVVGTSTSPALVRRAFRWTLPQGMSDLGVLPGGTFASAKAVSADGSVVVADVDGGLLPGGMRVARWTVDSGLVPIDALGASTLCAGSGLSSDGQAIVGTCLVTGSEAFRWTAQTGTQGLGRFGTGSNATSSASSISGNGRVIGGGGHPVLTGAVLWIDQVPMTVGGLAGDTGGAVTALSTDGSIAAGQSRNAEGHFRAFRWTASSGVQPLDAIEGSVESFVTGMSGDGRRMVGWATLASQADTAVVWNAEGGVHALSDLLAPDARAEIARWSNTRVRAVSGDGKTLVGQGVGERGSVEAWRVQLPD